MLPCLEFDASPCRAVTCSCHCPSQAIPTQAATCQQLTGDVTAAITAPAQDVEANMLPFASAAEESDSQQSWPGLFWLPPVDDEPGERDMLHLDDELAGLVEAADTPADQHGAHTTVPGLPPPVPGQAL